MPRQGDLGMDFRCYLMVVLALRLGEARGLLTWPPKFQLLWTKGCEVRHRWVTNDYEAG